MKIILSRKGFDSSNGGYPSPVFPDGRMVSLPIPASKSPTAFGDIQYFNEPIGPMVESLTKGAFDSESSTHLDPDLDPDALLRAPGWLPAFGQTGSAQTHLANNGVGPGDLFLFFGWFREAEETSIGWRYVAGAPDLHIIFGWLQVGEVLHIGADTARYASQYPWLAGHPHLHGERSANNTVYVATNSLVLPGVDPLGNLTGGGVFGRYAASRRLTAPGQGKRTVWRLPAFFMPGTIVAPLSCHADIGRWQRVDAHSVELKSVAIGQEFVMEIRKLSGATSWLRTLFTVGGIV